MEQGRLPGTDIPAQGPDRIYQRREVFVVGGQPTVTYNPRPAQGIDQRVRDFLEERGRILCITGPTKSGKTVLVREVLPRSIRVLGGEITSIEDFWGDVVDSLAAYTTETAERLRTTGTATTDSYGGSARIVGSGVDARHERQEDEDTTFRHSQSRDRPARLVAKAELLKTKPPLVVDDFHHLTPALQRLIVRGVKDLVFEGVPVVSPAGRFYARVVESFELAATTPLLLWMLSENHRVPDTQVEQGLSAVESWAFRRTLLRMTMKDVNKMMVAVLSMLEARPVNEAGAAVRDFLAAQTADARLWPTDADMLDGLPELRLYGNVRQSRLRVVLGAIEQQLRTERHESTALPPKLEIEHVMPRNWKTHWDKKPPLTPEQAAARSKRVDTIGNLTLVTQKLNGSLSHRPWTDAEATVVAPAGKHAGLGKRSLLDQYSLLVLNKSLIGKHEALSVNLA